MSLVARRLSLALHALLEISDGKVQILAHRAVLAVRSPYMYEQLVAEGGRWAKKPEIRFRNAALNAVAWKGTKDLIYSVSISFFLSDESSYLCHSYTSSAVLRTHRAATRYDPNRPHGACSPK